MPDDPALAAMNAALDKKFLDAADGDPVIAELIREAWYARLVVRPADDRRQKKQAGK